MGVTDLTLPRLGETMDEGRIASWLIKPGDAFKRGDVILEVETDKTLVEVPALQTGTLVEILQDDGAMVEVGAAIARIAVEGAKDTPSTPPSAPETPDPEPPVSVMPALEHARSPSTDRVRASPAARRAARETGIALQTLTGTGRGGRVQADDVFAAPASAIGYPADAKSWPARGAPLAKTFCVNGLFSVPGDFATLAGQLTISNIDVAAATLDWTRAQDPDPVSALAESLVQALEGADCVIGHSLGACLIAKALTNTTSGPKSLVLVSPFGIGTRVDQSFLDGMVASRTPEALSREAEKAGGPGLSPTALTEIVRFIDKERENFQALAEAIARNGIQQVDVLNELAALDLPVHIVLGREDRVLPWSSDGTLERLPSGFAVHFMDAGHSAHLTRTGEVAALIRRSLGLRRESGD